MLYRKFGKTDIDASAIGLGTWNIGNQWGALSEAESYATVRAAIEHGVNLYDTAESYGNPGGLSEERLGRALVGERRNVYIVTKFGNWGKRFGGVINFTSGEMVVETAHASLFRLRTDYLDVALCHLPDLKEPDPWLEGFETLKERGLLRYYGISTDSLEVLKNFNKNGTCSVVELDYSLLNKAPESGMLDYCQENGIGVLVRGPLAMGVLSGKYNRNTVFSDSVRAMFNEGGASRERYLKLMDTLEGVQKQLPGSEMVQTALRYIISHPSAPVAIPGAKSPEQAIMNAAAGNETLSPERYAALKSL